MANSGGANTRGNSSGPAWTLRNGAAREVARPPAVAGDQKRCRPPDGPAFCRKGGGRGRSFRPERERDTSAAEADWVRPVLAIVFSSGAGIKAIGADFPGCRDDCHV